MRKIISYLFCALLIIQICLIEQINAKAENTTSCSLSFNYTPGAPSSINILTNTIQFQRQGSHININVTSICNGFLIIESNTNSFTPLTVSNIGLVELNYQTSPVYSETITLRFVPKDRNIPAYCCATIDIE